MHLSNLHFESLLLRLVSGTVRINDGEIENSQGHTASCTRNPGITDSLAHSLFLYININVYNICLNYYKFMYMLSDKAFGEMNLRCRIQYWVSSCIYLCFSQLFPIAWIAANFIVIQQTNLMFVYKKFNQDFQCNINLEKDEWTHRRVQEKIDLDVTLFIIPDKKCPVFNSYLGLF